MKNTKKYLYNKNIDLYEKHYGKRDGTKKLQSFIVIAVPGLFQGNSQKSYSVPSITEIKHFWAGSTQVQQCDKFAKLYLIQTH